MKIHNLLKWSILTTITLLLSSSTPIFIYLLPFLPSSNFSTSVFFSITIFYCLYIFPFPIFLPPNFSLASLLSDSHSLSLSSLSLSFPPSHYFTSLLFSLLYAFHLNPTLHDTSYSSIFLSLSIIPSHFTPLPFSSSIPLPFPFLSMLFTIHTCTCKFTGPRRVLFNKIVNTNLIITKFATAVPHSCG